MTAARLLAESELTFLSARCSITCLHKNVSKRMHDDYKASSIGSYVPILTVCYSYATNPQAHIAEHDT